MTNQKDEKQNGQDSKVDKAPNPLRNDHIDYRIKIILSAPLTEKTEHVVWLLRNEPDSIDSGKKAVALLCEATDANLRFYFTEPAKHLKLSAMGIKLLNMGSNTILKLTSSVGNKIVHRLSNEQLSMIADFVEMNLLHRPISKIEATVER